MIGFVPIQLVPQVICIVQYRYNYGLKENTCTQTPFSYIPTELHTPIIWSFIDLLKTLATIASPPRIHLSPFLGLCFSLHLTCSCSPRFCICLPLRLWEYMLYLPPLEQNSQPSYFKEEGYSLPYRWQFSLGRWAGKRGAVVAQCCSLTPEPDLGWGIEK